MTDRLAEIFTRQASYCASLEGVIRSNGFDWAPYPVDLQARADQEELRLLAWRFTEELIEALNAPRADVLEELADCLHFLIELCIAAGVLETELIYGLEHTVLYTPEIDYLSFAFAMKNSEFPQTTTFHQRIYKTLDLLGQTMHCLRQRPWRKEDRPSDRGKFVIGLHFVFISFVDICKAAPLRFTADNLYTAYFLKASINDARQLKI